MNEATEKRYKGEVLTQYRRLENGKFERLTVHEDGFVYEDYVEVPEDALPEDVREVLRDL